MHTFVIFDSAWLFYLFAFLFVFLRNLVVLTDISESLLIPFFLNLIGKERGWGRWCRPLVHFQMWQRPGLKLETGHLAQVSHAGSGAWAFDQGCRLVGSTLAGNEGQEWEPGVRLRHCRMGCKSLSGVLTVRSDMNAHWFFCWGES